LKKIRPWNWRAQKTSLLLSMPSKVFIRSQNIASSLQHTLPQSVTNQRILTSNVEQ
jgi:hypothetical protein